MIAMEFPKPPARVTESAVPLFIPAPELREWAFATFIHKGGALENPDHEHLEDAEILFLWASYPEVRNGLEVAGTAEVNPKQEKRWAQGRQAAQFREWHSGVGPDFVITISAPFMAEADPVSVCAVIDHELYHCSQKKDESGDPKFSPDGLPIWAIRGHDVEEFVGVAARYGAWSEGLKALKTVLDMPPLVARSETTRAVCGCGAQI